MLELVEVLDGAGEVLELDLHVELEVDVEAFGEHSAQRQPFTLSKVQLLDRIVQHFEHAAIARDRRLLTGAPSRGNQDSSTRRPR